MAFHPYPQLIPPVFNPGGCGPPRALTRASAWPWVDHPASGPRRATEPPLTGLALATAAPHGLTSRHATDSQAHSSKGTPPPPTTPAGGSDGSQAPGFRYSFTPLPGYFSPFPHGTAPLSVTRRYSGSQAVLADSHRTPRTPCYHGNPAHARPAGFTYGGLTLYASPSQRTRLPARAPRGPPAEEPRPGPTTPHAQPLPGPRTRTVWPSSAFARHYSRNILSCGY